MTETQKLGDVLIIRKGKKAAKVFDRQIDGALPYIQIDEVRGARPSLYALDPNAVAVTEDDLCIVWDGANAGTVGYGVTGAIGSTVARMRLRDPDRWDARFLGRLLEGKFRELNDQAQARGATIPHVDKGKLQAIEFPAIDRSEQRRIASILDKADTIRRKHQRLRALATAYVKSAYVHSVGHLSPNYDEWESCSIEQLAVDRKGSIRSGPFGSALRHGEFVDEGIAVLGIDNAVQNTFAWGERRYITAEKYSELGRYRVYPNDVIITIMGTTGRSAVVPQDIPESITTKHLATITCDTEKVLPEVLSFAIHSDPMIIRQIEAHNKGAIMDGLNLGIIKQLLLKRPPMEEQRRFAGIIRKTEAMLSKADSPDLNGEQLLSALSQRAFRGDL